MLFLILTIIGGSLISIIMRLSEGRVSGKLSMLACNYITCMLLAGAYVGTDKLIATGTGAFTTFFMGGINGCFYMIALVLTQHSIKQNGVVLSTVFDKMGSLLVPLVVAVCAFGEMPSILQIIGAMLSMVAIVLMNYSGKREIANVHILLLLLLLSEGFASAMSKIFGEIGKAELSGNFLLYTFATAFVLSVIGALVKKEKLGIKEVLFGIMLGIPNFFASRFILKALETIPAIIVYPTRGVVGLLIVLLAGIFLFHEKLKTYQWWGIGVVFLAVILLNI